MENVAIRVKNVSKNFLIPHERQKSLKGFLFNILSRRNFTKLEALKDIEFEVKKGEFFGIIGHNGSGKSTLLKILSCIYVPSKGKIEIDGRLSPFIELGVGFNPELTARENIFLNGAILGLTRKEMEDKFDEIIGFAELEDFVDQKLKNFSSGMQVRLAFSVAIQAHAEILLIDEVLAVGDQSFQKKCYDVFRRLKKEGKTIIFVSHAMDSIKEFCDRAILVNKGKIVCEGEPEKVIYHYDNLTTGKDIQREAKSEENNFGSKEVEITEVSILTNGKKSKEVLTGDDLTVRVDYKINTKVQELNFGVGFRTYDQDFLGLGPNTQVEKVNVPLPSAGKSSFELRIPKVLLNQGKYYLNVVLFGKVEQSPYHIIYKADYFFVKNEKNKRGLVDQEYNWHFEK